MASVNKVILIGNLGREPEVRYTPSGTAVCNISLATSRHWKSKESGERQEETEWHRVVFYDRLAEIAGEYAKKGKPIYVEGRLKTRKWQDKDGKDQYTTEIIAESLQLLGGREDGENESAAQQRNRAADGRQRDSEGGGDRMRRTPGAAAGYGSAGGKPQGGNHPGQFDDMESDVPF